MILTDSQKWLSLAVFAATTWLLYALAPVLTPFLTALLLGYLFNPLVTRLQLYKLSRTLAVVLVFVLISLMVLLLALWLLPKLQQQIIWLVQQLPHYVDVLQQKLPLWALQLGLDPALFNIGALKQLLLDHLAQVVSQGGGVAVLVLASISKSGMAMMGWLANMLLIPVVLFYVLRDWPQMLTRVDELLPRRYQQTVQLLAQESDAVLGAFLRGQLSVMLALAVIYSVGLWLAGLQLALLIGLLAGAVSFVPYLGFIVGLLVAGVAMLLQTHDVMVLLPVLAVFGSGQVLESMLLTPWLVGDRIGLHPVAVIFAVLAGGQLFGFVGVLLALPMAAVLAVMLRHLHQRYTRSALYHAEHASLRRHPQAQKKIRRKM